MCFAFALVLLQILERGVQIVALGNRIAQQEKVLCVKMWQEQSGRGKERLVLKRQERPYITAGSVLLPMAAYLPCAGREGTNLPCLPLLERTLKERRRDSSLPLSFLAIRSSSSLYSLKSLPTSSKATH